MPARRVLAPWPQASRVGSAPSAVTAAAPPRTERRSTMNRLFTPDMMCSSPGMPLRAGDRSRAAAAAEAAEAAYRAGLGAAIEGPVLGQGETTAQPDRDRGRKRSASGNVRNVI